MSFFPDETAGKHPLSYLKLHNNFFNLIVQQITWKPHTVAQAIPPTLREWTKFCRKIQVLPVKCINPTLPPPILAFFGTIHMSQHSFTEGKEDWPDSKVLY